MSLSLILKILAAILACGSLVAGVVFFTNNTKEQGETTTIENTETITESIPTFSKVGVTVSADNIQYYPCDVKDSQGNALDYDFSVIERNGKYGLIDFNGEEVLPVTYGPIREMSARVAGNQLYIGENIYLPDYNVLKDGQLEQPAYYPEGDPREDVYWYNGQWVLLGLMGVYDRTNTADSYVSSMYENYEKAEYIKYYNYYSSATLWNTSAVIPVREILETTENMMPYGNSVYSDKWGLLDIKNNKMVSGFVYDEIDFEHGFSNGLLAAKKDGKWGYINEQGEVVIDFIYDECSALEGCEGKQVKAYPARNGYILVCVDNKYGFVDLKGNTVIEPIYDDASQVNKDGKFWLCQNGEWELYKFD